MQTEQNFQSAHRSKATVSTGRSPHVHCRHCGAVLDEDARFCEECGTSVTAFQCVHCGREVDPSMALCPACGMPITVNCTFCGSPMEGTEQFCQECGNPRSGIRCGKCGVLNFRSFCRNCNSPLNGEAREMVEQAHRNPHFIKATSLARELAEIEEKLAQLENEFNNDVTTAARQASEQPEKILETDVLKSERTLRLLEEFSKLKVGDFKRENNTQTESSGLSKLTPKPQADNVTPLSIVTRERRMEQTVTVNVNNKEADEVDAKLRRLQELQREQAAKANELRKELDAMIPPAGSPPEIKRNFACAHKVTVRVRNVERVPVAWVCNKCGVWHKSPAECCVAEFGGQWQYVENVKEFEHKLSMQI